MKIKALLVTSAILLVPAMPSASAVDFIQQIDATVLNIHDYSVLSGNLDKAKSADSAKKIISTMNSKLSAVRSNLVTYDSSLSYNWKVLIDNDNANYPHRQLLKDFNIEAFAWFNFEQKVQQKISDCYKLKNDALACVVKNRKLAKNTELKNYTALTNTLDSIASWRKQYNR